MSKPCPIFQALLIGGLTDAQSRVLAYLVFRANGARVCWPKIPRIALDLHIAVSTVREAIRVLSERGLIAVNRQSGRESTYRILDPDGVLYGADQPLQNSEDQQNPPLQNPEDPLRNPEDPLQNSEDQPVQNAEDQRNPPLRNSDPEKDKKEDINISPVLTSTLPRAREPDSDPNAWREDPELQQFAATLHRRPQPARQVPRWRAPTQAPHPVHGWRVDVANARLRELGVIT